MNATCRLFQEGCCGGSVGHIETTPETAIADAVAWAAGQTGWPWDGMLVVLDSGEDIECRCDNGAWEVDGRPVIEL